MIYHYSIKRAVIAKRFVVANKVLHTLFFSIKGVAVQVIVAKMSLENTQVM